MGATLAEFQFGNTQVAAGLVNHLCHPFQGLE